MAEPVTTATPSSPTMTATTTAPALAVKGIRVNGTPPPPGYPSPKHFLDIPISYISLGKNWKSPKTAFRPQLGHKTTWETRSKARKHQELVKAKEKELRDEKEAIRQVR